MLNHLLIIDDSDADLLYSSIVAQRAGVARVVTTHESATEALAFLQQPDGRDVDLIFLDINMPGMNGFQFLEAFEALCAAGWTRPPVIAMLTSSPDPTDRERAFSFKSVRDYLIKPINVDAARQLMHRLMAAGGQR